MASGLRDNLQSCCELPQIILFIDNYEGCFPGFGKYIFASNAYSETKQGHKSNQLFACCVILSADFFFETEVLTEVFRNIIKVSKSLDKDHARHYTKLQTQIFMTLPYFTKSYNGRHNVTSLVL